MPNIIINNYCNLSCPYCFAGIIKQEKPNNITEYELYNILSWLEPSIKKQNIMRIGIIGGEPTLHPNFLKLIEQIDIFCQKHKIRYNLFTNGIELYKYIENLPKNIYITLNYNSPKILTNEQKIKLNQTLSLISKKENLKYRTVLGCNICNEIEDYNFFWEAINQYHLNSLVRLSVVSPIYEKDKLNKDKYYQNLKIKFLNFMELAIKNKIKVVFDCNQIPLCYFSSEEIKKYNLKTNICEHPAIDINYNFEILFCFGASIKIDGEEFINLEQVQKYYTNIYSQLQTQNNSGKCNNCIKLQDKTCQGGCLAFSKYFLGQ